MKKITVLCLLVLVFSMTAVADDFWKINIGFESQKTSLRWLPARFLDYSDENPAYNYKYMQDIEESSGNLVMEGFFLSFGRTFLKNRVELSGGILFNEITVGLENPKYRVESSFETIYGYNSSDVQTCIGDSVRVGSSYKPLWFVSAKFSILKNKSWEIGTEIKYFFFSSKLLFPLQDITNNWGEAKMKFSVNGNSVKFQGIDTKLFVNFKISKKLEILGAVVYAPKTEIKVGGKSEYKYDQGMVKIDYNHPWEMLGKPKNLWSAEISMKIIMTKRLETTIGGYTGGKSGFHAGISYYLGRKNTVTTVILPATKPNVAPEPIAPEIVTPVKSDTPKKVMKPTVKLTTKKKTAVAPKEEAKPTVIKNIKITHIKKVVAPNIYILSFFNLFNIKLQITPTTTPASSKK